MSEILSKLASPRTALALAAAAVVTAAVVGSSVRSNAPAAAGPPAGSLVVDAYQCGDNWTSAHPGLQNLTVYNDGTQAAEVYLVNPSSGAVFGEVVGVGAGTTAEIPVDLGDGSYALRCLPADADPVTGPAVKVSGAPAADAAGPVTPGVLPVTREQLIPPTQQYQAYVVGGLAKLLPLVDRLAADITAGNLDAARADWVPAHQQYERLGGAYDAFGDAGDAIDGLPGALAGGASDPAFAGFHRIEYGLWHEQTAAALAGPAAALVTSVTQLQTAFPTSQIDPLAVGLRTHEILEDSVRFELSGQSDQGSGTSLATVDANIDGTETLLGILTPILTPRDPQLQQIRDALTRLRTLVEAQHAADGTWTPLSGLTTPQREAINSAAGNAVELLSSVATICEPRIGATA